MDFGAHTPEVNSARMYVAARGAAEHLLAAAAAWGGIAVEVSSCVLVRSVIG